MTQISKFWQGISTGDAGSYSSDQFSSFDRYIQGDSDNPDSGRITGSGTRPDPGLTIQQRGAGANMSVDITLGAAIVNGTHYLNDATVNLAIASNASGNPRIDTIVLNKDWSAQTIRLAVVQGTPAGSPIPPSMVQSAGVQWQIPLTDVAVANGAVSITNANITPRHMPANVSDGVYLQGILNNSNVVLQTGDVVIWDTSADRAVKTTTTIGDRNIAGVWVGRTAIAGYGRLLVQGVGYINAAAAVTRGQVLQTHSVAKQATPVAVNNASGAFAFALQTTSGAGLVLATIDVPPVTSVIILVKADPTEITDSNSAAETTMWSTTVQGGMLGPNDSLAADFWLSIANNSGANRTLTVRIKYRSEERRVGKECRL